MLKYVVLLAVLGSVLLMPAGCQALQRGALDGAASALSDQPPPVVVEPSKLPPDANVIDYVGYAIAALLGYGGIRAGEYAGRKYIKF